MELWIEDDHYLHIKADSDIISYLKYNPFILEDILQDRNSSVQDFLESKDKEPLLKFLGEELIHLKELWLIKKVFDEVYDDEK